MMTQGYHLLSTDAPIKCVFDNINARRIKVGIDVQEARTEELQETDPDLQGLRRQITAARSDAFISVERTFAIMQGAVRDWQARKTPEANFRDMLIAFLNDI